MGNLETSILQADWTQAAEAVLARGWVRLAEAVPTDFVSDLVHHHVLGGMSFRKRRGSFVKRASAPTSGWSRPA